MSSPIHAAIAKRFSSPEFATFWEVRDAAGFNARRSADVVAMNTWPSRGLAVHGIEVKTARSDWLRELKDPAKSASVQRFCDRWWLATSDDKVCRLDEVPQLWGLLVLRGKSLVQVKDAPELTPEPLTRGFVAMLLRNATAGLVPTATLEETIAERVERAAVLRATTCDGELKRMTGAFERLRDEVADFEKASGIKITERWSHQHQPEKLGAVVKAALSGVYTDSAERLTHLRSTLQRHADELGAAIEALKP